MYGVATRCNGLRNGCRTSKNHKGELERGASFGRGLLTQHQISLSNRPHSASAFFGSLPCWSILLTSFRAARSDSILSMACRIVSGLGVFMAASAKEEAGG
jgi:hypothetical protein